MYCSQTSPSAPPEGADVLIVMLRTVPAGLAPLFTVTVPAADMFPVVDTLAADTAPLADTLATFSADVAVTLPEESVTRVPL